MSSAPPLSDAELAALDAAAMAATPGPWARVSVMPAGEERNETGAVVKSWGESPWSLVNGPPQVIQDYMLSRRAFERREDAEYIALANPATILSLLSRLRSAEARSAEARVAEMKAQR